MNFFTAMAKFSQQVASSAVSYPISLIIIINNDDRRIRAEKKKEKHEKAAAYNWIYIKRFIQLCCIARINASKKNCFPPFSVYDQRQSRFPSHWKDIPSLPVMSKRQEENSPIRHRLL